MKRELKENASLNSKRLNNEKVKNSICKAIK